MTIEEIESNIYDSLISIRDENDKKKDKEYSKKMDYCIYSFAVSVFFLIISLLIYSAYLYFKNW